MLQARRAARRRFGPKAEVETVLRKNTGRVYRVMVFKGLYWLILGESEDGWQDALNQAEQAAQERGR